MTLKRLDKVYEEGSETLKSWIISLKKTKSGGKVNFFLLSEVQS